MDRLAPAVVLPPGTLEVVLEGETEDDEPVLPGPVDALLEDCLPKVAPKTPPKAAPTITRNIKEPMTIFFGGMLVAGIASPTRNHVQVRDSECL